MTVLCADSAGCEMRLELRDSSLELRALDAGGLLAPGLFKLEVSLESALLDAGRALKVTLANVAVRSTVSNQGPAWHMTLF